MKRTNELTNRRTHEQIKEIKIERILGLYMEQITIIHTSGGTESLPCLYLVCSVQNYFYFRFHRHKIKADQH